MFLTFYINCFPLLNPFDLNINMLLSRCDFFWVEEDVKIKVQNMFDLRSYVVMCVVVKPKIHKLHFKE